MKLGLQIAAWIIFAAIVAMTVGPLGLRPESHLPANFERFAAFVMLGTCFMLAYPQHSIIVLICLIVAAGALELAQTIVPGRHGRVVDFAFKLAGVVAGVCAVKASRIMISRV
jgi:VanZ family protein